MRTGFEKNKENNCLKKKKKKKLNHTGYAVSHQDTSTFCLLVAGQGVLGSVSTDAVKCVALKSDVRKAHN